MVMYVLKKISSGISIKTCFDFKEGQSENVMGFIASCFILFFLSNTPSMVFADPVEKNPLKQIDVLFRGTYNHARQNILQNADPIIIASGEDLTLLRNGTEAKSTAPPAGYRALTTISHITLTIFLLLEPYGEGAVSPDRLDQLKQLDGFALAARQPVAESLAFNPSLAAEQQTLIDTSRAFIQKIVGKKNWVAKELGNFLETVKPQILKNIKQAAKFRIDHFHRQMIVWKKTMPKEEWGRLHVVVLGAAMPRKNNLAVQYFSKLLGVRGEGLKITYAESMFSHQRALQILGTNLLDAQIGVGYFGDPWRMHRDLLGNAAAVYLDERTLSYPDFQTDP